jgi:hypothetical protein
VRLGVRTIPIDAARGFCRAFAIPRPLRPIADGLVYHVINRGNARQPVFLVSHT